MRKAPLTGLFLIAAAAFSQQLSYEVRVINIEVPVRVFSGDQFVDHLGLDDFEVFEDGVPQPIEAVYLVRNRALERKEEKTAFQPETSRHFFLFFSLYDYDPKIPGALNHFFQDVIKPGDRLTVITPRASYDMKKELVEKVPWDKIAERLTKMIRKDIQLGAAAYRSVLADLKRMAGVGGIEQTTVDSQAAGADIITSFGSGSVGEYLMKLRSDFETLEQLRTFDEKKFLAFALSLKQTGGQKTVFYFYQKEFVPTLHPEVLRPLQESDILSPVLAEILDVLNRRSSIQPDRIKKAFSDASINVYFLYLAKNPDDVPRIQVAEGSADIFPAFDAIAQATGGITSSSANTESLMRAASKAAESYYLLYYSPKNKSADGKFRTITVRAKSGSYRLTHLAGYFSR